MTEVRKIQCPSCGSNSTYKLFDGSYKCNYCQGSFMVHEPQGPAPINRPQVTIPAAKPQMIIALVLGIIVLMGAGAIGFFVMASTTASPAESHVALTPQPPAIKMTKAFAGKAGGVVWIITANRRGADSLCYELRVVEPLTNTLKGKRIIVPAFKQDPGFDLSRKLSNDFWQYGDLAYNLSDDNGLLAYDIYTGETVWDAKRLSEKIPGLKSGILKVEHRASEKLFELTTMTGDVFKFDPLSQTILPAVAPAKTRQEEPLTQELYLSDGLKHQLYLFSKRGNGFPIVFGNFVQESRLPEPGGKKQHNVKDIFGNDHIEQISEKNYFRAQPLLRDVRGNLLVMYKTDLSATAPVILESVNKEGKANWSLQDTSLMHIGKAFASDDLGCYYTYSDRIIIIGLDKTVRQYMAIDIATGKILWRFDPQSYMEKQSA